MAAFISRVASRIPSFQLNFRERRNTSFAIVALGVVLFFGIPIGIETLLIARRSEISDLRNAIDAVQGARTEVRERQYRRDQIAMRYAKKAPLLAGFLQQAAHAQNMEVTDSSDHPDVPIGKKYVERSTVIHLKKVGLLPLSKFMETIEKSGEPIAVTTFSIRKRTGEPDSYDVELGLSAYDRNEAPAPASSGGAASKEDGK
jgi:general secretion pathway protein M